MVTSGMSWPWCMNCWHKAFVSTDRAATPEVLEALHRSGQLSPAAFARALSLSCASPSAQRWRRLLDWLLLGLGVTLLLVGVVLLVAFNWAALPAFVKLGLVAALITSAAFGAWHFDLSTLPGRLSLTGAAVLIGPLLAIYGQTYQTGADPWQLFLAWAALGALWAVISNFAPLQLIELVLVDVTFALFWEQVGSPEDSWRSTEATMTLVLGGLQLLAWAGAELGAHRGLDWLQGRWLHRLLAVATLGLFGATCAPVVVGSSSEHPAEYVGLLALIALLVAMFAYFTQVKRDLFMVAAALAAAMSLITFSFGRVLLEHHVDVGEVFVLGVFIITEVGSAAWLLRGLHRRWEGSR